MTVKAGIRQNKLILTLCGEIDDSSAESIRTRMDGLIAQSECDTVIFDLGGVSFMDSTGIGLLLGRYKRFRDRGVHFYLQNPSLRCDKIFTLSGIYHVIPKLTCYS